MIQWSALRFGEWYSSMGLSLESPHALLPSNNFSLSLGALCPGAFFPPSFEMYVLSGIFSKTTVLSTSLLNNFDQISGKSLTSNFILKGEAGSDFRTIEPTPAHHKFFLTIQLHMQLLNHWKGLKPFLAIKQGWWAYYFDFDPLTKSSTAFVFQ